VEYRKMERGRGREGRIEVEERRGERGEKTKRR
jgi:hypothetical protein